MLSTQKARRSRPRQALAAALAIACMAPEAGGAQAVRIPPQVFFRLKVDVEYKGKPLTLSPVIGCSVRHENIPGGGISSISGYGITPNLYAVPTGDGSAIGVIAPAPCEGQNTPAGTVSKDFFPILMLFEDMERIDTATAYVTPDAYEVPGGVLKHIKAMVEPANENDFLEFRQTGTTNIVSTRQLLGQADPIPSEGEKGPGISPTRCTFFARYENSTEMQKSQDAMMESSENGFRFPRSDHERVELILKHLRDAELRDSSGKLVRYTQLHASISKNGYKLLGNPNQGYLEIYPAIPAFDRGRFNRLSADQRNQIAENPSPARVTVDFDPRRRGMAYCYADAIFEKRHMDAFAAKGPRISDFFVGHDKVENVNISTTSTVNAAGYARYFLEKKSHFWEYREIVVLYPGGRN